MLYPVIGAIQARRPGLTDEASEYIIKSVINHLPVIEGSVFASVAPVPGSFAVKYQDPDMPADPPKNELRVRQPGDCGTVRIMADHAVRKGGGKNRS